MKTIELNLRIVFITIFVCSVLYPGFILAVAQTIWSEKSTGSLVTDNEGNLIGSRMIAQKFTKPEYVYGRPSAVDFKGDGSGGSNWGGTNPALRKRAEETVNQYYSYETNLIPVDAISASGSGLDPFISEKNLEMQLNRIAKIRNFDNSDILAIINNENLYENIFLDGTRIYNVFLVNLYLDNKFSLHKMIDVKR
ncbi:potassium-transporting ATPase subunit C [Leptospira sp. 96542]|nr:potassium-transporting ATPase subunit C [Leptospira sp. 96542]